MLAAAWDLARRVPLVEAAVALDALAHRRAFAPSDLLPGARRRLDWVVALADPKAESPMETWPRVGHLLAIRGYALDAVHSERLRTYRRYGEGWGSR